MRFIFQRDHGMGGWNDQWSIYKWSDPGGGCLLLQFGGYGMVHSKLHSKTLTWMCFTHTGALHYRHISPAVGRMHLLGEPCHPTGLFFYLFCFLGKCLTLQCDVDWLCPRGCLFPSSHPSLTGCRKSCAFLVHSRHNCGHTHPSTSLSILIHWKNLDRAALLQISHHLQSSWCFGLCQTAWQL